MAYCPICGSPIAAAENQVCENCRRSSYTAYTDAQGRPVFASEQPQQPQKQRPPATPITRMLLAANIAVFVLMVVNGVPITGPQQNQAGAEQLFRWGAEYGPLVLAGQYWRMLTAVFLHNGILHLALNMWSLWQLGRLAERLLGRSAYLTVYLLSGVAGNILSIATNPLILIVGASGAIFGLAGALIAVLIFVRLTAPPEQVTSLRNNLIVVVAINLIVLGQLPHIGNMAHIGGLICGFALAYMLSKSMNRSPSDYRRTQSWVFPLATVGLAVIFMGVRYWRLPWLVQHLHLQ